MASKRFAPILWKTGGIIAGLSLALAAARWNWVTLDGSRWVSRAAVILALLLLLVPPAWRSFRRREHP